MFREGGRPFRRFLGDTQASRTKKPDREKLLGWINTARVLELEEFQTAEDYNTFAADLRSEGFEADAQLLEGIAKQEFIHGTFFTRLRQNLELLV